LVRARVDINALARGYAEPGEVSEIIGGGPIPPAFISAHLAECIFELIATKGKEVHSVVTDSRHVARVIRMALEERDRTCSVPGCVETFPLEMDHWHTDYTKGGQTRLDNLLRICRHHHYLKTHKGWRFEGEPGNLRFVSPESRTQCSDSAVPDPPGDHPPDGNGPPRRGRDPSSEKSPPKGDRSRQRSKSPPGSKQVKLL
jgi:hypothetical protein